MLATELLSALSEHDRSRACEHLVAIVGRSTEEEPTGVRRTACIIIANCMQKLFQSSQSSLLDSVQVRASVDAPVSNPYLCKTKVSHGVNILEPLKLTQFDFTTRVYKSWRFSNPFSARCVRQADAETTWIDQPPDRRVFCGSGPPPIPQRGH